MVSETERTRQYAAEIRRRYKVALWKTAGNAYAMSGLPDEIGIYNGLFIAMEFKRIPNFNSTPRYSPKQIGILEFISKAGGFACGVLYVENAKLWILEIFSYNTETGKVKNHKTEALNLSLSVTALVEEIEKTISQNLSRYADPKHQNPEN